MNLVLVAGGEEVVDLLQTPTDVTLRAIRSGSRDAAFEVYAAYVRREGELDLAEALASWHHDELDPDPLELHLRRVSAAIAFADARFDVR